MVTPNKIIISVASIVFVILVVVVTLVLVMSKPEPVQLHQSEFGIGEPVSQNLSFAGVVGGRMTSGQRGSNFVCLPNVTGPIIGKVGNDEYSFEFTNITGQDAGSYKAFVQIIKLPEREDYYGGGDVELILNSDLRSGSVNGELVNLKDGNQKVRITGEWQCPSDI